MKLIVAVDKNFGIGYKDNLLFSLKSDMLSFKSMTTNNVVVYGRKTLSSFPNQKPLPNRINLILSSTIKEQNDAKFYTNIDELLKEVKEYEIKDIDVFVIGGAMVYKELLPYCSEAYITKVNATRNADKFFVNIDKLPNWEQKETIASGREKDRISNEDVDYSIIKYQNNETLSY